MEEGPHVLASGMAFPECPRWHDNKLWFVDMFGGQQVLTVDMDGHKEVIRSFDDRPGGIGFLPDGVPIVVMMSTKKVVRIDTGELYADLSEYGGEYINDMVVDSRGRAYIGRSALPKAQHKLDEESGDSIIVVDPDGSVRVAAGDGLHMPNGLVITPDEQTLIAAMPPIQALVAFSIKDDGTLHDAREFAHLGSEGVDGMCLDAEGAIWVASPRTHHFSRFHEGGRMSQQIAIDEKKWSVACMLGGPNGNSLFMATTRVPENPTTGMNGNMHLANGFIEVLDVGVPRAGRP